MPTITAVLDELGISTAGAEHRHGRQDWVQIDCPFCHNDPGKFHLGINLSFLNCNCWKCGRHSLYDVLLALTRDKQTVRELLSAVQYDRRPAAKRPVLGRLVRPLGLGPLATAHIAYLRRRALNALTCSRLWGALGIGIASRLRWRIYLPIYYHGQEVSWTTRSIGKSERRYINASPSEEVMSSKSLLYGADYCRSAAIVHEGPLDVWRTGPGSVALFGLNYTQAQVAMIAQYPLRVICFDNQERAQAIGGKLARDLSVFPGETVQVQLESGEDPGSADEEELEELRKRFLE